MDPLRRRVGFQGGGMDAGATGGGFGMGVGGVPNRGYQYPVSTQLSAPKGPSVSLIKPISTHQYPATVSASIQGCYTIQLGNNQYPISIR